MSKDRQNLPGKATPAPARPSYWSFYNNEWTETNSDSDDFFNGDYCEDGTFTAKLEARNARSRINIEAKARHLINVYERVEQNQLSEAINLYLDLP